MSSVKNWAQMLCIAAVGCGALMFLLPGLEKNKLFRLAVGAFFLLCIASPLKDFDSLSLPSPQLSSEALYDSQEAAQQLERDLALAQAKESIEELVRQNLEDIQVEAKNVEVQIHMDKANNISFIEAHVLLSGEDAWRASEVRARLEERLGVSCTVSVEETMP